MSRELGFLREKRGFRIIQFHDSDRDFCYFGRRLLTYFLAVSSGRILLSGTRMVLTTSLVV